MKNILANFYLFSKFTISIILLICLIGSLYILYSGYKKEEFQSNNISNDEKEIKSNIKNNSDLIINLSNEIMITQDSIADLKKIIEANIKNEEKPNITAIKNDIQNLNKNLEILSKQVEKVKKETLLPEVNSVKKNAVSNSFNNLEILDLILLKYENNYNFDKELDYLKKISSEDKNNHIDKLLILSNKPFKGHNYIKIKFNEEVNLHLKNIINQNPNSFFNRIVLPYIEISPSSENVINDDTVLKIKEIETHIINNNIEEAYIQMKYIENYEDIFELSLREIVKFIEFKTELMRLN